MARFHNICTEVFHQWQPKLLKWLRLAEQNGGQAKNRKTFKRHLLRSQCPDFSNFTEVVLLWPFTKIADKMAARAKNRKKNPLNISSLASYLISE